METGVIWVSICRRRQSLLSYEAAIATAPWELTVCSVDAKSGQTTCPVTCVCKVWLCRVSMVTGSSVTERKPSKTSKKVSDSNSIVLFLAGSPQRFCFCSRSGSHPRCHGSGLPGFGCARHYTRLQLWLSSKYRGVRPPSGPHRSSGVSASAVTFSEQAEQTGSQRNWLRAKTMEMKLHVTRVVIRCHDNGYRGCTNLALLQLVYKDQPAEESCIYPKCHAKLHKEL